MSRPLWGGSAAVLVLLSASLTFNVQTSVAEPLAQTSQAIQSQQKSNSPVAEAPAEAGNPAETSTAGTGDAADEAKPVRAKQPTAQAEQTDASRSQKEAETVSQAFTATAYNLRGRTASGQTTKKGLIAADRKVLPIGTRVRLDAGNYSGEYVVADTGGAVRGRKIDIWVPSLGEATRFGRRAVKLTVLTRVRTRTTTTRKPSNR